MEREAERVAEALNDTLFGGLGNDTPSGGSGQDTFPFDVALTANVETITGFDGSNDMIQLDRSIFIAITTLSSTAFSVAAAAHASTDLIIYNSATGNLLYDRDGNGSAAAVQFAHLNGTSTISNTNSVVAS